MLGQQHLRREEGSRTGSLVIYNHDSDILCHDWVCTIPWISVQVHGSGSGRLTSIGTEAPLHELVLYRILRKKRQVS